MKILVISQEVWRYDTNGGNVLSNIFEGYDAEFAQIYCSPGTPANKVCKKYYQMTDSMVIRNILKRKPVGKILNFKDFPEYNIEYQLAEKENKKFYGFFRSHSFPIFHIAKEFIWFLSKWNNNNLKTFIVDFNPDLIFAPCYGSHIMLSIDRYVNETTNKPMISYISDDSYSLKQFNLSPLYWINRFVLRKNLRKTFPYYNLTYTMTDEQLKECQKVFHCNMKILRKGVDISLIPKKSNVNTPIKLIYAGGIYCGRWRTLVSVVKALQKINKDSIRMVLDIYTGNELSKKQQIILNDRVNSFVRGVISQEELKRKYSESDIALHVESFDLKNRLLTKISFSTKIIDCLTSGCAVMTICWNKHSGYKYLQKEDAAICIGNTADIYNRLSQILDNSNILKVYAEKAYKCSEKNHQKSVVQAQILSDFKSVLQGE